MSDIKNTKTTALVARTQAQSTDSNAEHLLVEEEFKESCFPSDIPVNRRTREKVSEWVNKKKTKTQSQLALLLACFFGGSLMIICISTVVVANNPNADKAFIKDMSSQLLNSQQLLLAVIVGYYFGQKNKD